MTSQIIRSNEVFALVSRVKKEAKKAFFSPLHQLEITPKTQKISLSAVVLAGFIGGGGEMAEWLKAAVC